MSTVTAGLDRSYPRGPHRIGVALVIALLGGLLPAAPATAAPAGPASICEKQGLEVLARFGGKGLKAKGSNPGAVDVTLKEKPSGKKSVSWSSLLPVDMVVVGGSKVAKAYKYKRATSGKNVTPRKGKWISKVVFCHEPLPDLHVAGSVLPNSVGVGDSFTYELAVSNIGTGMATDVVLEDLLDRQVRYLSAKSSLGDCAKVHRIVNCYLGDIEAGGTATVSIDVRVESCGQIPNGVEVWSAETEENMLNNSAFVPATVSCADDPDLDVFVTSTPEATAAGDVVTYTIDVMNLGDGEATGVVVENVLGTDVWHRVATTTQGDCKKAGPTINCYIGTMPSWDVQTITIEVRIDACGDVPNTAQAWANESETDLLNNSWTTTTAVSCVEDGDDPLGSDVIDPLGPDLQVFVAGPTEASNPGDTVEYTISVQNLGFSDASKVVVESPLGAGVWYQLAVSSQGTCTKKGPHVTCNAGDLASGDAFVIALEVRIDACGEIPQTASATALEGDADPIDNTSTALTPVTCPEEEV